MSKSLTMAELRAQRKRTMGEELGGLHFLLEMEVTELHLNWAEYRTLYAETPETVAFLNRAAPRFFYRLEKLFWHDILLSLCRLTDPPQIGKKQNLTIRRLPEHITDAILKSGLEQLIERSKDSTSFARDWRNRHLAHRDFERAKDPTAKPLAAASRAKVEEALADIRSVLNAVQIHYENSETGGHVTRRPGGAASLVHYLQLGLENE